MKDDAPAFLTVTSLQLPDSPIPLVDSQANRSRESTCARNDDKDAIMDELLRKVVAVRGQSEGQKSKRRKEPAGDKCNRDQFTDLEECTRRIIEGPGKRATRSGRGAITPGEQTKDCICSEVSENLRINIGKKTEVRRSSGSPSPEVTHVIRIAMKYNGQLDHCDDEVPELVCENSEEEKTDVGQQDFSQKPSCPGVSVALDFTLNCSSLQLTSRDVCVRTNKARDQSEEDADTKKRERESLNFGEKL